MKERKGGIRFWNARNFCPVLVFVLGDFCPLFFTWTQRKFNKYPTVCCVYCELDVWHASKVRVWYLKQEGNLYSTIYFVVFRDTGIIQLQNTVSKLKKDYIFFVITSSSSVLYLSLV
jgi:hypothetical protein